MWCRLCHLHNLMLCSDQTWYKVLVSDEMEGSEWEGLATWYVLEMLSALHSIALSDPNSIQGTSIWKVVCLSSGWQTWPSMNSGCLQDSIMMLLSQRPSDPLIAVRTQRNLYVLGPYWCRLWLLLFALLTLQLKLRRVTQGEYFLRVWSEHGIKHKSLLVTNRTWTPVSLEVRSSVWPTQPAQPPLTVLEG